MGGDDDDYEFLTPAVTYSTVCLQPVAESCTTGAHQRCHSEKIKNLDGPIKNPRKPKVKFLCNWQKFHENATFSGKNPHEESVFNPPKFLMTFLVINSDFQIF